MLGLGLMVLLTGSFELAYGQSPARAEAVFQKNKDRVLRVRILEKSSEAQQTVGSGFVAGPGGLAVTNFHVVSSLLWEPESYEAAAVLENGEARALEILDVDVIHDLALVRVQGAGLKALPLAPAMPNKGQRLFALGNPHDLGMTVVEGSFSGLLEDSLIRRVHFTGSVNPGMSGGPVLDSEGRVVGVSVASSGEQVSFLVPAVFVRALLDAGTSASSPEELKKKIAAQLTAHQEEVLARLDATPLATQGLGPFKVPGQVSSAFRCWANTSEAKNQPYDVVHSECGTNDRIYINDRFDTGRIGFVHHGLASEKLNALQFSAMQRHYLDKDGAETSESVMSGFSGAEDDPDVTPYDCRASLVDAAGIPVKGVVCLRAYKRFPGLYDFQWRGASLAPGRRAFTTSLSLEGVSKANGARFLRRYLEAFAWKK